MLHCISLLSFIHFDGEAWRLMMSQRVAGSFSAVSSVAQVLGWPYSLMRRLKSLLMMTLVGAYAELCAICNSKSQSTV